MESLWNCLSTGVKILNSWPFYQKLESIKGSGYFFSGHTVESNNCEGHLTAYDENQQNKRSDNDFTCYCGNAIELTICFETNFTKSRNYKINRYNNLSNDVIGNYIVKKLFLEISSLGFYTNDAKPFIKFCKQLKVNNTERMLKKCSEAAIRASFFLNIRKNKEWPKPSLLSFV